MTKWEKNKVSVAPSISQNLILLTFVSSKPLSDWKSVEFSRTASRFLKILPHWNFFSNNFKIILESSQTAHSILTFFLKNFKTGHFYQVNMWWDMTSYVILFLNDVTKSLKRRKWRHISSQVHFIKKLCYNNFQYKISDRMSYLWAVYENFEFFW